MTKELHQRELGNLVQDGLVRLGQGLSRKDGIEALVQVLSRHKPRLSPEAREELVQRGMQTTLMTSDWLFRDEWREQSECLGEDALMEIGFVRLVSNTALSHQGHQN